MSQHKTPRLNARNWELLADADSLGAFRPMRIAAAVAAGADEGRPDKLRRSRETFHRPRSG